MEEIRLRGRNIETGEWNYWHITGTNPVTVDMKDIDLNTVGRYIGKKDASQNCIYEGDIIENIHGNCHVVGWNKERLSFECGSITVWEECRIIGNIHEADNSRYKIRKILEKELPEDVLSTRTYNSLKALGVQRLADIVKYRKMELEKARNIGDKSIVEIETLLKKMDLSFGMDIAIYGFGTNSISL